MQIRNWFGAIGLSVAVALGLGMGAAAAQYPTDTIHVVVPYPAGGGTDAIGRALAAAMEEQVDVAVVVDNVTGGAGATGSHHVAQARPDGHTVLLTGSTDLIGLTVFRDTPFGVDDYVYVGGVYSTPTWAVANTERGYEDLSDVLEAAKANPGQVTVGIGGRGSAHHVMAAAIIGATETDMRIVAYDGGVALRRALIANEVDFAVIHSPVMLGEIEEGMIQVLAAGGSLEKIVYEPVRDTKTLRDFGVPVDIGITRGIFAPAGTPPEVVDQLAEIVEEAAKSDRFREFGLSFGFEPVWLTGEEFESIVRAEHEAFVDIKSRHID